MSVMEFVLVAHAIIVGLAVAEILRGFSELFRSRNKNVSYRLILIAVWTLLLLLQLWWAVWHVSDHEVWSFAEFLLFLLPVGVLYVIARLCFPAELTDVDLEAYYAGVAEKIWWLVAATYASFAFLLAPFIYGGTGLMARLRVFDRWLSYMKYDSSTIVRSRLSVALSSAFKLFRVSQLRANKSVQADAVNGAA